MLGAEYKAFMESDWDTLLKVTNAYVDAQEVTVDGVPEPDDVKSIPDDAKVIIHCGCVMADQDLDLSFKRCFTRWKTDQTTIVLCIQVPKDAVENLTKILAELKVKVLQ